ncbi:hypothetical protein DVA81_19750, partial [Acinetobacter baumannii]
MYLAGKTFTEEIFQAAGLPAVVVGNTVDSVRFGGFRNGICAELRRPYPEKMNFPRRWRDETGSAWNVNNTTQSLFK